MHSIGVFERSGGFVQDDDLDAFKRAVAGIKPIKQDKYTAPKKRVQPKQRQQAKENKLDKQARASFTFSDMYEAHFDERGPLRYCRDDIPAYTLKQLRRGDYSPEWVLDCHGMTKEEVKQELVSLLFRAHRQHINCISILHGVGSGVLKRAVPNYLVQHPNVQAFHQAPLEYGGHGALVVLLDVPELR